MDELERAVASLESPRWFDTTAFHSIRLGAKPAGWETVPFQQPDQYWWQELTLPVHYSGDQMRAWLEKPPR